MAATRSSSSTRILVVGIIAGLVVAGGFGAWFFVIAPALNNAPSGPEGDGPTFYDVVRSANSTVENTTGGPWSLFSVYGIAAQVPFSMNVWGYPSQNVTVNACMAQFNGLTTWNGTPPVFHGSFDSGTAPFWQLGYYSVATQEILVVTDTMGLDHIYAPMSISSPCGSHAWYDFPTSPDYWANQLTPLPVNTPLAAATALPMMDPNWISKNQPLVEIYTSGPGMLTRAGDRAGGAWSVIVQGCGMAGVTGIEPLILGEVTRDGQIGGVINATTNCSIQYSGPPAGDDGAYGLLFSPVIVSTSGTTSRFTSSFQVGQTNPNGSTVYNYDGWGLANWMVSLNLTNPDGVQLPMATSGCSTWVPSISDCLDNSSGWYAVLLSPGGQWLGSFGAPGGQTGWTVPVVSMVDHQQLVIVVPSGWRVSGDSLGANSTTAFSVVRGQLSL